jgi:D-alanyl-D-alanine carboxypeptidase
MDSTRRAWLAILLLATFIPSLGGASTFESDARALLRSAYPEDGPGAAVIVSRAGSVLFQDAVGMADLELGVPLAPSHVFRLGSITKTITAAAILALADDGMLALDDPLRRYLPDFPAADVTIHQLLNHTSGIRNYTSIPGYLLDGRFRHDLGTTDLLRVIAAEPTDFEPGQGWAYSNSGYALLGAIIEEITGLPWHEFLSRRFFDPLELHSIGAFRHETVVRGRVRGYQGRGAVINAPWISMTQAHAGSGLYGTVADVDRWQQALHAGELISSPMLARMLSSDPLARGVRQGADYGYGVMLGTLRDRPVVFHSGGIHGFSSYALWMPGARLSVVVLSNHGGSSMVPAMVARRLAARVLGDPYPIDRPRVSVATTDLAALAGTYRAEDGRLLTLELEGGALWSVAGSGATAAVEAVRADRFVYPQSLTYFDVARTANGRTDVTFYFQGDGEPVRYSRTSDKDLTRRRIPLSENAMARLAGTYELRPGLTISVRLEGAQLYARVMGQAAFPLAAASESLLYNEALEIELDFDLPEAGPAWRVTLLQMGERFPALRAAEG